MCLERFPCKRFVTLLIGCETLLNDCSGKPFRIKDVKLKELQEFDGLRFECDGCKILGGVDEDGDVLDGGDGVWGGVEEELDAVDPEDWCILELGEESIPVHGPMPVSHPLHR